MTNKIILLLCMILMLVIYACKEQSVDPPEDEDIFLKLQKLNDVEVTEITPQNGYERQFELIFDQPVTHQNEDGESFRQRVFLSHIDISLPVVLVPSGYSANPLHLSQLTQLLNGNQLPANQVYAEQRFMSSAGENPSDWTYLTSEEAAHDFHIIVQKLKVIYKSTWMSDGSSKGGISALFHKRYFPDDVAVTTALVAPLSLGPEDPRYIEFLETIGDEYSRNKIKDYQRALLLNRNEILPKIKNYMNNSGLTFSIPEGIILEMEACEFAFSFWQTSDRDVESIPDADATADELYNYLADFGYFNYYSRDYVKFFEPVYYQAYTELGWYGFQTEHLEDLFVSLSNPSWSFFAPKGVPLNFNSGVMPDLISWLQQNGNNIIYVYGEEDPWTAGAIDNISATNSLKIIEPSANHSIRLNNIQESQLILSTLKNWTGYF